MRVDEHTIEKDITVFYVVASSFPAGIADALDSLYQSLRGDKQRNYYGISSPQYNKGIVYKACAEQLKPGEGGELGLKSMIIPNGVYYCIEVNNFRSDPLIIGKAFEFILSHADIDPQGFCLESYGQNPDLVKCLVRKSSV